MQLTNEHNRVYLAMDEGGDVSLYFWHPPRWNTNHEMFEAGNDTIEVPLGFFKCDLQPGAIMEVSVEMNPVER